MLLSLGFNLIFLGIDQCENRSHFYLSICRMERVVGRDRVRMTARRFHRKSHVFHIRSRVLSSSALLANDRITFSPFGVFRGNTTRRL